MAAEAASPSTRASEPRLSVEIRLRSAIRSRPIAGRIARQRGPQVSLGDSTVAREASGRAHGCACTPAVGPHADRALAQRAPLPIANFFSNASGAPELLFRDDDPHLASRPRRTRPSPGRSEAPSDVGQMLSGPRERRNSFPGRRAVPPECSESFAPGSGPLPSASPAFARYLGALPSAETHFRDGERCLRSAPNRSRPAPGRSRAPLRRSPDTLEPSRAPNFISRTLSPAFRVLRIVRARLRAAPERLSGVRQIPWSPPERPTSFPER